MNIQVLVAAMNQTGDSLIDKMNIQTDAIIANQCDECCDKTVLRDGFMVKFYNRTDRGVGLNRNEAILHSSNEVLTFADEDMVFVDGYEDIIKTAFDELPDADAIVFNIDVSGSNRFRRRNNVVKRLHFFNCFNYGAARLSVRSTSIKRENILFHTCFGGGTIYNAGEDSIFIADMLKHKLKIYAYPAKIAFTDNTNSTWFNGYNEKYLHDKGALFSAISSKWAKFLCIQALIRHRYMYKECGKTFVEAYRIMKRGIKNFKHLKRYNINL